MSKSIAILPARGGSKRIPSKNIRPFNGRPMLAWPLAAAQESGLFDAIHVSTDSAEVSEVAASLGHPPSFSRPAELADDMTPLRPVIRYVLTEHAKIGQAFERAFVLFPCAPFLTAEDLRNASELYDQVDGAHDVLSICAYPVPVEWAFHLGASNKLLPRHPKMLTMRSQDIQPSYYETGTFAVFNVSRMLAEEISSTDNFIGAPIPRERAIDIDTLEDWSLAERIHAAMRVS